VLENDGDQPLTLAFDTTEGRLTISAPDGYVVVSTDITGCVPQLAAAPNEVTCPLSARFVALGSFGPTGGPLTTITWTGSCALSLLAVTP